MNEIEKMSNKDKIVFVSLSMDRNKEAWKKWVVENNLQGVQLRVNNCRSYVNLLVLRALPRFIIIAPDGTLFKNEAPRPLSGQLEPLLKSIGVL